MLYEYYVVCFNDEYKTFNLGNFVNLYEKYILPPILNCACGLPLLRSHRQDIVKRARGSVLEIGIGSSLNKDFYNHEQITGIVGLDPNESLLKIAQINESDQPNTINLSGGLSEQLPFPNNQFDSVVVTFSLCTIPKPEQALKEIGRVLKSKGALHFCEHGLSHVSNIEKLQKFIEPIWKPLAGGCHLSRDMFKLVTDGGFQLCDHEMIYADGVPKFLGHLYKGSAKKIN
ncbi:MAG: methyltransferase domain-containing protein [Burkholderiales bacterium]|nr:methyltransferase domain-containing protein [Burkholderiales bacterium]OUT78789.1 MAG: hypothetical protein CBB82_02870 [Betaproteobacteria bacterium TMED22]|tara:strand:+ start:53208 stop:53897 length:690 start_codon:yes stop_codon:yes gene_type:complete